MESQLETRSKRKARGHMSTQAAAILDLYRTRTGQRARTREELDEWIAGTGRSMLERHRTGPGAIDLDDALSDELLRHAVRGAHLLGV
jgi:hypothetical protein